MPFTNRPAVRGNGTAKLRNTSGPPGGRTKGCLRLTTRIRGSQVPPSVGGSDVVRVRLFAPRRPLVRPSPQDADLAIRQPTFADERPAETGLRLPARHRTALDSFRNRSCAGSHVLGPTAR